MKFTCDEDGSEWEKHPYSLTTDEYVKIKRITPAQKSLYEKCKEKIFGDVPYEPKEARHLELLCQAIEQLEKRVEELEPKVESHGNDLFDCFMKLEKLERDK
jgi:predicted nuclease with TOPRIM domain